MQVLALGGQRENFLWIVPYLLFVAIFFFFFVILQFGFILQHWFWDSVDPNSQIVGLKDKQMV